MNMNRNNQQPPCRPANRNQKPDDPYQQPGYQPDPDQTRVYPPAYPAYPPDPDQTQVYRPAYPAYPPYNQYQQQPGYPPDPDQTQVYPPAYPAYQNQQPVYPPYQQQHPAPPPGPYRQPPQPKPRRRSGGCCGCLTTLVLPGILLVFILLAAYFLAPLRTNLLVLGIDRTPDGSAVGRSDTIILMSVIPLKPDVNMLSIPRDLWVNIPGVGENRINTAHFFAEAAQPGSGPEAAVQTVEQNFGVKVPYYVRIRFDTFLRVIDAFGGVTVDLPTDMAGLPAGRHHLNGEQALAFVRDRQGADDFFRMSHGQLLVRALIRQSLTPETWQRFPDIAQAVIETVDTNLPFWQLPRLGLAVLRAGMFDGINSQTIQREMTVPTVTSGGAQVLLPQWDAIRPLVQELFGQ